MTLEPSRFALVTGAESNTGYAIARSFAADGAQVFLHAPTLARAEAAADRLRRDIGTEVLPVGADFRQLHEIEAMMDGIHEAVPALDVLVNCAVDLAMGHTFLDVPTPFLADAVNVNFTGLFLCSQLAARRMAERRQGVILNLGSSTSTRVTRKRSVYVSTKGAVATLTRAMAVELGPYNIRVNCVAPGHIHTDRWHNLDPGLAAKRRHCIPLGREAYPGDIANTVLFLASEQARCISGAELAVDGGTLAQMFPSDYDG